MSDSDLIARVQKGEMSAFEELVCRYDKQVLSIALNYTRNREDARDIYQEVFLRTYRSLKKFRFQSAFSTWLHRITVNTCLTYRSRRGRAQELSLEDCEFSADQRPGQSGLHRHSEHLDVALHIEKALKHLSPRQKLVFVMRHFDGWKLREIASALECSEGTIKKHLFTATRRMREQLKEFSPVGRY